MAEWKLHPKWRRYYRDFEDSTGCWRQWDNEGGSKTAIPRSNVIAAASPADPRTIPSISTASQGPHGDPWGYQQAQSPPSSDQSSSPRLELSSPLSTTSTRRTSSTQATELGSSPPVVGWNSLTSSIPQNRLSTFGQLQSDIDEASTYVPGAETTSAIQDVSEDLEIGFETPRDPRRPSSKRRPSATKEDTHSPGGSTYELTSRAGSRRMASPAGDARSIRSSRSAKRSTGSTGSHEDLEEDLTERLSNVRLGPTDTLGDDLSEIGSGAQNPSIVPHQGSGYARPSNRRNPSVLATVSEHRTSQPNFIRGNPDAGSEETLDSRYKKRLDPKRFFKLGRIFALLWHEPFGDNGTEFSMKGPATRGKFGQRIYSSIRRMVVVLPQRECCWCLPISTYQGQATTKSGLDPSTHAIVYMRSERPGRLADETGMTKTPLVVDPARPDQKLDVKSRINFAKIYTVEHNVKVMEVGQIGQESLHLLETYWKNQVQLDPE